MSRPGQVKQFTILALVACIYFLPSCNRARKYEKLSENLQSGNRLEKVTAINKFSELGPADSAAIPVIVELMQQEEYAYRGWKWLSNIGKPACPTVLSLLDSTNPNQKLGGLLAFNGFVNYVDEVIRPGASKVLRLCNDKDPAVRGQAIATLWNLAGFVDDSALASCIQKGLDDPDRGVVAYALSALALLANRMKSFLPRLVRMIEEGNDDVRHHLLDATFYINANEDEDLSKRIIEEAKQNGYEEILTAAKEFGIKE